MKATATQYAKTLYEATKNESGAKIDAIAANFVNVLKRNNQLKLKESIIRKFGEIYNSESGIIEVQVTSREELSSDLREKLERFIRNRYEAKKVVISNMINREIIGGIIIKVGDEVIDGSVKGQLKRLKLILEK